MRMIRLLRAFYPYAAAVTAVILATVLRFLLLSQVGGMPLFITFYPAVALVTLMFGWRAGVATTLLSASVAEYVFLEPHYQLGNNLPADWVALGLFIFAAMVISFMARRVETLRRIEAEAIARRESQEVLEELVRTLDLAHAMVWDLDSRITRWSQGSERLYGYRTEEAIGKKSHELLKTQFPDTLENITDKLFREGFWKGELIHTRADGNQIVVGSEWALHRDADGNPISVLEINTDVTARKKAEEALREGEQRYRSFVEASSQIVWTTNERGEVNMEIPAWQAYTGQSAQEARGFGWMNAIRENDRERVAAAWAKAFETRGIYEVEYLLRRRDGEWRSVLARGVPVLGDHGEVREYVGTCIDITERKRAEENLKKAVDNLARSNRDLQQFAYVASHDLQEPLRQITSFVQLLEHKYASQLNKEAVEYMDFIVEGAKRMHSLIVDLLAYSRVESAGQHLALVPVSTALDQALFNLKLAIQESHATIERGDLPTVRADKSQLVQVFQNLVGNALKFHGASDPVIRVSVKKEGREWVFSVRDNGIGFPSSDSQKIFQLFQRLHNRESYAGTGIGLTICKRIIERHGGRIWADSSPGNGSVFSFTLPVGEEGDHG